MIKKIFSILFAISIVFIPSKVLAKIQIEEFAGNIYVENATVKELEELFGKHKYLRFHSLKDNMYPAIFVKSFPTDFQQISSQKYRNELFIRILTPLILKINEEILNERNTLLRIERLYRSNNTLSDTNIQTLEALAKKYDYFTRTKKENRITEIITNLKLRIDKIPVSVLVAYAAIESNWGTSRIANKANSLYKEKVWHTTEGLMPEENKDDGYRFKIFNSLVDSIRSYALTFNSNKNYYRVWIARNDLRNRHKDVFGESLAYTLSISNNLPNFAGILTYTTAFYDLYSLDIGKLKRIQDDK